MSTETPWPTPLPSPYREEPSQQRPPFLARTDLTACLTIAAASAVLAFGVGALWRAVAPNVLGVISQGDAYLAAPESKTFVARDGWFAIFACSAAVLLALFGYLRYRRSAGIGAVIGLAGGGIGGGYLAAWFGAEIGPGRGSIANAVRGLHDGAGFDLPLKLRALGVIWLWPAVAVGLFFILMLLFGPSEHEAEPQVPVNGYPQQMYPFESQAQGQQGLQSAVPPWGGYGGLNGSSGQPPQQQMNGTPLAPPQHDLPPLPSPDQQALPLQDSAPQDPPPGQDSAPHGEAPPPDQPPAPPTAGPSGS